MAPGDSDSESSAGLVRLKPIAELFGPVPVTVVTDEDFGSTGIIHGR